MKYDHIILGTGQATGTLLGKLIGTGESIAVIEGGKVGGSCVNYGCTPTKTMVASAKAIHTAKRGQTFGFEGGEVKVDYARIIERMNKIRNTSKNGLTQWMEDAENVTLMQGWGKFTSKNTLEVNGETLEGGNIYINVGTRPSAPPIQGLDDTPWLDSARLLDLQELPKHLLILGGGYIGVEFAQIFKRFGSEVTILQRGQQLMPREDEDVANGVKEILEDEGIEVLLGASANEVTYQDNTFEIEVNVQNSTKKLKGDQLLVATGRKPNSDTINAEAADLTINKKGYIEVDEFCRTNIPHVFALGDVNGRGAFTHTSVNDAEIVLDLLYGGNRTISKRNTIYALFTDPPLGRVGMSEKEALATGRKILKATKPMSSISRAKEMSETKGFAKLLVDAETDLIIGAAILGTGGDEVINMFAAIMHSQIPCKDYRKVVLVHPTVSELMPFVLDGIEEASKS